MRPAAVEVRKDTAKGGGVLLVVCLRDERDGERDAARAVLEEVQERFAGSSDARAAERRLTALGAPEAVGG